MNSKLWFTTGYETKQITDGCNNGVHVQVNMIAIAVEGFAYSWLCTKLPSNCPCQLLCSVSGLWARVFCPHIASVEDLVTKLSRV